MAKTIACGTCGSVYDEAVLASQAAAKKADKITLDGSHPVQGPVQKSILCRVCGALVYRTVDGEKVCASRAEHLAGLTAEERDREMTAEEKAAAQ